MTLTLQQLLAEIERMVADLAACHDVEGQELCLTELQAAASALHVAGYDDLAPDDKAQWIAVVQSIATGVDDLLDRAHVLSRTSTMAKASQTSRKPTTTD